MKKIVCIFMVFVLSGCATHKEIIPVVSEPDPSSLLAQPPAEAMIAPVSPTPLSKGASNSENIAIIRQNNINAALDRGKLEILQQYVRGIFSK